MKSIKGFTLLELVVGICIMSILFTSLLLITKSMYKMYDYTISTSKIDEEVNTISKIFDDLMKEARLNYKNVKVEQTLENDNPIIKISITKTKYLIIHNYGNQTIEYQNNVWTFTNINMFYIYDYDDHIVFSFVDRIFRYHRIVYNFYEII